MEALVTGSGGIVINLPAGLGVLEGLERLGLQTGIRSIPAGYRTGAFAMPREVPETFLIRRSRRSRAMPLRSSITVETRRTRVSRSSRQITGTSVTRTPRSWARTSNSVSKNHQSFRMSGRSSLATVRRRALKPH